MLLEADGNIILGEQDMYYFFLADRLTEVSTICGKARLPSPAPNHLLSNKTRMPELVTVHTSALELF